MTGVEAAAISAVVSVTLKNVGNKLAPLLIRKYSSIVGVKKDLQELHGLVEEINDWLEKTADNSIGSTQSFAWLKKLKDISYDVDDVVDEFQLKAEKHDSHGDGGVVSKHLCACTIPKSFAFQWKAANKIKAIKKRFAAIVKQRTEALAIKKSLSVDPHVRPNITVEVAALPNVDEALVVGRDKDKQMIISMLEENDDQQKIKIVSVIGLGGSRKTTLAKLVFNDGNIIERHLFEVILWVHVSKEFVVNDLIKKLFEAFSDNNPGTHALPYMNQTISDKLKGKRFLLVLDDVWTNSRDEWEEFMVCLKVGAPKSRILLTTRNREVAVIVGSTNQFHLPFLSPDDSWQLFQQSLVTPPAGWDFEFEEVGKAIVDKCGGVPLAIKVLACALHGKERIEEWQDVRDKNLLNVDGKEDRVVACLRLSYFHLPFNLKQCFTICSVFPKGRRIDKEQLIDLWIAHDMITPEAGVEYLEDIGHKYFNSLVQMSFLQDVAEDRYGRVECGMHDLVHDLAMSILDDKISLVVPKEATGSTKSCRYFSLIEWPERLAPKNCFRKARAIYMCWHGDYTNVMALKHAKHLRSVLVEDLNAKEANTISQVKYLKYLSISLLASCKTLPEGISDVWSLQALHVTHSYSLVEIPESIGKLRKLRTLNLSGCRKLKHVPESIGDCEMISSIDLSHCWDLTGLLDSINNLQKLRTLDLSWCSELKCLPESIEDCQMISSSDLSECMKPTGLPDSIGKLHKLRTLNLSRCIELKCLPESIGNCQMISSIDLSECTKLTGLPDSIGKLQKLRTLNISWFRELKCLPESIGDCQMISIIDLGHCWELTVLPDSIDRNEKLLKLGYTKIERLPSRITKLRNLECLDLQGCCELVELPEGIGNLEKLQVLNLKECEKLGGMPIGIGQLSRLQKLGLFVVGKGEKFAGISELSNICRISELTIRGISNVMDPSDAHMACLKEKTQLQRLELDWMADDVEEVNTELEQAVLDGLEPPPGINELEISSYSGSQYGRWMHSQVGGGAQGPPPFPFLRVMRLCNFPNMKHLDGLVELPCLEELVLERMPSLESISGGPFLSLLKLKMHDLPCLGEVWMVAERTMPDGEEAGGCCNFTPQLGQVILVSSCLTELKISYCPRLEVKPQLPRSLQHLRLWGSEQLLQLPGQCQGSSSSPCFSHLKNLQLCGVIGLGFGHGWELLQHLTALESLKIMSSHWSNICMLPESLGELRSLQELTIQSCRSLSSLPESMGQLTFLQELIIKYCDALRQLPNCLGELYSLRKLEISECPGITSLPQGMEGLVSLEELEIRKCMGLTSLPQGMKGLVSLEELHIYKCPGVQSLPEGIKCLTVLKELWIWGCPDLERRYERETGEDWHLISHIPHVRF